MLLGLFLNMNDLEEKNVYTGCPKRAERSIFVTLIFENIAFF